MSNNSEIGKIGWIDMTVDDAEDMRDFYKTVVGWGSDDVSMGEYSACTKSGGEIIVQPRGLAGGRFCVIRDPAGATAALYQP